MNIISKVWLYGGWFYITLFSAVGATFYFKKLSLSLYKILISVAVFFVVFFSTTEIIGRAKDFYLFFRPIEKKIDEDTLGQFLFAKEVKKILPRQASGCVYLSWDTPTAYLIQELYPYRFKSIADDDPAVGCGYVISQFKPRAAFNGLLLLEYKNNYLYKGKH